jgi:hypothetical protein
MAANALAVHATDRATPTITGETILILPNLLLETLGGLAACAPWQENPAKSAIDGVQKFLITLSCSVTI